MLEENVAAAKKQSVPPVKKRASYNGVTHGALYDFCRMCSYGRGAYRMGHGNETARAEKRRIARNVHARGLGLP